MNKEMKKAAEFAMANPVFMFATLDPDRRSHSVDAGPDHLGHWASAEDAISELKKSEVISPDGRLSDGRYVCLMDFRKGPQTFWRSDRGYINN